MSYKINFQKAQRNFMTLTFDDVKENGEPYERVILVGMPKKRIFDMLLDLRVALKQNKEASETASEAEKAEQDKRQIASLYELTAAILSNNMNKEKISVEWVEDQMNIDEIKMFLKEYTKFTKGEAANPN